MTALKMMLRRFVSAIIMVALVCGPLTDCAQLPGNAGANLTANADDPCSIQRERFSQTQTFFSQDVIIRTAAAGVGGAAVGAGVGGLAGGTRNVVIGMLVGLGAGVGLSLASNYWTKLQEAKLNQSELDSQVSHDVNAESTEITRTSGAFASLRACRFATAERIKYDVRRGTLTRAQGESELAQERRWFDQEVDVAQEAGLKMQKRDDQFAYAARSLGGPRRSGHSVAATATVTATETIPQKRNSFESSVQTAQAESNTAFALDTSTGMRARQSADA